jgi:AAA+ ATPase superfamily predicted ATPase
MKIREYKNSKFKQDIIKMSNDGPIKNVDEPLPQFYNFFMLLVGRPNSGKTSLLLNMLNKKAKNSLYKKFDKVYIFSASLKTVSIKIKLNEDQIFDDINELEGVIEKIKEKDEKTLIIFDDFIAQIKDDEKFTKLIFNRRHIGGGCSVIITSQIFNKLKNSLRKCATDLIIYSTSNKRELESIYTDYINIPKNDFFNLCRYVFQKDNHQFLWVKVEKNEYYHNLNKLELDI